LTEDVTQGGSDVPQREDAQQESSQGERSQRRPIFPPWTDHLVKLLGMGAAFSGIYVVFLITFGLSPWMIAVGYMPKQPIPYSHAVHVGELGMDCRYCHTSVEHAAFAAIPPTQTCMSCHGKVHLTSELLEPAREAYATGEPIEWIKVHDLPGYVYFNHSAHVARGVSCVSCHGRVDRMEEVWQEEPLSMGWCLNCHRSPEEAIRPVNISEVEKLLSEGAIKAPDLPRMGMDPVQAILEAASVTNLGWGEDYSADERKEMGRILMQERGLLDGEGHPTVRFDTLTNCSTCHR